MAKSIIAATHRSQLFRRLGTFWSRLFKQPKQVRILLALTRETSGLRQIESVLNNLGGNYESAALVSQTWVSFRGAEVIETGNLFYASSSGLVLENGDSTRQFQYGDNYESDTAFGVHQIKYYGLHLKGVTPLTIQARGRRLVLGIDFFIQADRYILFRQDPKILFPDHKYLVALGVNRKFQPLINFTLRTRAAGQQEHLIAYYRKQQTPHFFKLALAATAGLQILSDDQKLMEVRTNVRETVYVFEQETLRVDYLHTPLEIGLTYPKHYIIGDGIQVYQATEEATAWWRQVDWTGGLSLDPLLRQKGLALVDGDTDIYSAGSDTGSIAGSKLHARIQLSGDAAVEQAYWNDVARKETASGHYLNNLTGLPEDTPDPDSSRNDTYARALAANIAANEINKTLGLPLEPFDPRSIANRKLGNPLDLYFQAVLDKRAFIIVVKPDQIKNPDIVFNFITRELPIGCTPVIFSPSPNLPVESFTFGGNIQIRESVLIQATVPQSLTESLTLGTFIRESVVITQETPLNQ